MQQNTEVQLEHYNRLAHREDILRRMCSGAKAERVALRAPYQFVESWLSQQDIQNKKVLDLGCGSGVHSIPAAQLGAKVTGIDISPKQIALANERAKKENVSHQTVFKVGNVESLPFENESFDYIINAGTLSCVDLTKTYGEVSRVLRKTGTWILIETLAHNPLLTINRKIKLIRGMKTKWSVDHILKMDDLLNAKKYFHTVQLYFFDFFTVLLTPLIESRLIPAWFQTKLISLTQKMDRFFFSKWPLCKPFAFKVVGFLSQPCLPLESEKRKIYAAF